MRKLRILLGAIAAMACAPAIAQDSSCGPELNYEEADIRAVVDEIAKRTGRTFLIDPSVQGRITVKSPPNGSICADEAWELFQAMLRVNDFTAIPIKNGTYKIVPVQDAARSGVRRNGDDVSSEEFVTEIVRLRYVDAREAAANLAQIIGDNGVVSPVRGSNSVILVDTSANVTRLRGVLRSLDRDSTVYRTIALNHASAADAARVISDIASEITEDNNGAGGNFSVVPVEASNSVLIRAEPDLVRRLETVVAELDRFGQNSADVSVVRLNHASAEELAPILSEMANESVGGGEGPGVTRNRAKITFHASTNSIIISGDADIQRTLQNVIAQLDSRQPQVLVEAIIVEMSDNLARDLGVQAFLTGETIPFSATNFSGSPDILPAAGVALLEGDRFSDILGEDTTVTVDPENGTSVTQTNDFQAELARTALNSLLAFQGLGLGGGFRFGQNDNIFGAVLTAIQNDSESNVLSTPSVMTLDNQTARLQVGQEIPITTGEAIGDDFTNAFRTVNREQVGVILEVTPQINEGDSVRLELVQEISSVAGAITTGSSDVITNKREISTTALVDDGDILVIGGLIDDSRFISEEKVPFVGDLPGIGNLFKQTARERRRQNLMVFIRPTIVRDRATAGAATRKKLDYVRARDILQTGDPVSDLDRLIDEVTGVEITGVTVPADDE